MPQNYKSDVLSGQVKQGSTYIIGDVQGCFSTLEKLLEMVHFSEHDQLWFVGDLVNRGPGSLETLRFIKGLGDRARTVLGNHDLHLIGVYYGYRSLKPLDTLEAVLQAPDAPELIEWLCQQPLIFQDLASQAVLVHAGIPPIWTLQEALMLGEEISVRLRSLETRGEVLAAMTGPEPTQWSWDLAGADRDRILLNYFTRLRFCTKEGRLEFDYKGPMDQAPSGFQSWFSIPRQDDIEIFFGHWAALEGYTGVPKRHALDTGCVWGRRLTALRLSDAHTFSCEANQIN